MPRKEARGTGIGLGLGSEIRSGNTASAQHLMNQASSIRTGKFLGAVVLEAPTGKLL